MDLNEQQQLFEAWMSGYLPVLIRVAGGFAKNDDRDDLVQDMMLAVWKAVPAFRAQAQPSTFIYRTVYNCALMWHRGKKHHEKSMEVAHDFAASASGVTETRTNHDQLVLLYSALDQLRPVDRSLMMLSLDGLSYREMSEIVGLSESNVGARLTRIREKITTILKEKDKL